MNRYSSHIKLTLMATSMSLLTACDLANAPPSPSTPIASPSATAAPTAEPTATPGITPSAEPTTDPGTVPSPTATPAPNGENSASPLPSATADISVIERTTFNGQVFDDTNAPLNGVTITAKSLNSSVPFEASTTTAGGAYAFNNAPAGVQLEIIATRAGYTTRRRVEVLKSNKQGDPNANKYDFGTDGSGSKNITGNANNALSDKPEMVSITPGRNASGIAPNTSFVLRFSEPMDTKTVEDNFVLRSFTEETLTVGNPPLFTVTDAEAPRRNSTFAAGNFVIGEAPSPTGGTKVWDKDAFSFSWNSDETEITFSFSNERMLPTDKESANTPDYYFTFNEDDGQLKDKSGVTRSENYFKLTDGRFEGAARFSIQTDRTSPTVRSITAQTAENSGASSDGDVIKVVFSERMVHYTSGAGVIAGGRDGIASKAAAANNGLDANDVAANYEVEVIGPGIVQPHRAKWSEMPTINPDGSLASTCDDFCVSNGDHLLLSRGRAIFDTRDLTHKTVLLIPENHGMFVRRVIGNDNIYRPGDTVRVTVSSSVMDPAGNTLDSSRNTASATAS